MCFTNHKAHAGRPLTMHCNALHAADGAIPSIPGVMGAPKPVLSPVTLTFDLDIETCLSEGPNTSFL